MIIEVKDLTISELHPYTLQNENQLKRYFEPELGYFMVESPNVAERAINAGYIPVSFLVSREDFTPQVEALAERTSVPVYLIETEDMRALTGLPMTRGMLGLFKRKAPVDYKDICEKARRIAVLENVVNPTNVGAIIRSAAALNVDAVLLSTGCADPLYRRCSRVSMGTVFQVPWATIGNYPHNWAQDGISLLHEIGFKTAAMALTDNSVSIADPSLKTVDKLAIILGTEGAGLLDSTIQASDYTVKIPMTHGVDSLNVAAAGAVAFWELCNS